MPFVPVPQLPIEPYREPCRHPEHKPPNMIVLPPGVHVWKCPACGEETILYILETSC
jgi:hypothetical protein